MEKSEDNIQINIYFLGEKEEIADDLIKRFAKLTLPHVKKTYFPKDKP